MAPHGSFQAAAVLLALMATACQPYKAVDPPRVYFENTNEFCKFDSFHESTSCTGKINHDGTWVLGLSASEPPPADVLLHIGRVLPRWAFVTGDAKYKVDGGEIRELTFVTKERQVISGRKVVDGGFYVLTSGDLDSILSAETVVEFWVPAERGAATFAVTRGSPTMQSLREFRRQVAENLGK